MPRRVSANSLSMLCWRPTGGGGRSEPAVGVTDGTGLPFLRDADDTPIPFGSRVVQVTVDEEHGAQLSRLHQQGQAIGRGTHLLYVRFECDRETIALRPDLARVLTTTDGV